MNFVRTHAKTVEHILMVLTVTRALVQQATLDSIVLQATTSISEMGEKQKLKLYMQLRVLTLNNFTFLVTIPVLTFS